MGAHIFWAEGAVCGAGRKDGDVGAGGQPIGSGGDRIVNGVAAFHKYGGPCIVVDFARRLRLMWFPSAVSIWAA